MNRIKFLIFGFRNSFRQEFSKSGFFASGHDEIFSRQTTQNTGARIHVR